jgi:hypothetical protein
VTITSHVCQPNRSPVEWKRRGRYERCWFPSGGSRPDSHRGPHGQHVAAWISRDLATELVIPAHNNLGIPASTSYVPNVIESASGGNKIREVEIVRPDRSVEGTESQ